ncbi:MAG: hypothetical protein AB7O57_07490 [Hyphomicrobiaceae bacterium]
MMKSLVAAAGLAAVLTTAPALAAPLPSKPADGVSMVESAQGYHYRKDCYWTGSGWGYKHRGKVLVCRPHRPRGAGWAWHSEGGRHGWYHSHRKSWHHNKW